MRFREMPAAIVGQLGEKAASAELRRHGASVIASYQFSGRDDDHAPVLEFERAGVVLPDLDVSQRGRRRWIEVKTYERAAWNTTAGCYVHGIPVRLFDAYAKVEQETGSEVYLAIVEITSGEMIIGDRPLSQMKRYPCLCEGRCRSIRADRHIPPTSGIAEMQWYFDRDEFTIRYRLADKAITSIRSAHGDLIRGRGHAQRRHGENRETQRAGALAERPPWTWACLACNATDIGSSVGHRCPPNNPTWMQDFWVQRLRWALPTATIDHVRSIVTRPIARAELAKILGDRWLPSESIR
jgi:hypothetical protein